MKNKNKIELTESEIGILFFCFGYMEGDKRLAEPQKELLRNLRDKIAKQIK